MSCLRSVRVSNIEYIALSIETTSIGVIREQISVKVTTSENNIETLLNILMEEKKGKFMVKFYFQREFNFVLLLRRCRLGSLRAEVDLPPVLGSFDIKARLYDAFPRPTFAWILRAFSTFVVLGRGRVLIPPTAVSQPTLSLCRKTKVITFDGQFLSHLKFHHVSNECNLLGL